MRPLSTSHYIWAANMDPKRTGGDPIGPGYRGADRVPSLKRADRRCTREIMCYRFRFFRRSFLEICLLEAVDFAFILGMAPPEAIILENCVPIFIRCRND